MDSVPPNFRQVGVHRVGTRCVGTPQRVPPQPSIPCRYETVFVDRLNKPNKGFGARVSRFYKSVEDLPGPGSYHNAPHHDIERKSDSLSKKGFGNGFVSKTKQCFAIQREVDSKNYIPGPNAYKPADFLTEKEKATFNKAPTTSNYSAPTQLRNPLSRTMPGPGAYHPTYEITGKPKVELGWKMKEKRKQAAGKGVDGCSANQCKYPVEIASSIVQSNLYNQFGLKIPQRQLIGSHQETLPHRADCKLNRNSSASARAKRGFSSHTPLAPPLEGGEPLPNFGNNGVPKPFASSERRFAPTFQGIGAANPLFPGPGAHDITRADAVRVHVGEQQGVASNFISKNERPCLIYPSKEIGKTVPGPGTYDPLIRVQDKGSMGSTVLEDLVTVVGDPDPRIVEEALRNQSRVFKRTEHDRFGNSLRLDSAIKEANTKAKSPTAKRAKKADSRSTSVKIQSTITNTIAADSTGSLLSRPKLDKYVNKPIPVRRNENNVMQVLVDRAQAKPGPGTYAVPSPDRKTLMTTEEMKLRAQSVSSSFLVLFFFTRIRATFPFVFLSAFAIASSSSSLPLDSVVVFLLMVSPVCLVGLTLFPCLPTASQGPVDR